MLLVNGKTISASDFCKEYGLDYEKILKTPVFELAAKYQKNGKKIPSRVSIPSRVFIKDKKGDTIELRYAENRNYRIIKNERVEVFTPRYIPFEAQKNRISQLEKAVYLVANPHNETSPFGNGKNCDYFHVDPTAIAKKRMESVTNTKKALDIIDAMKDDELIIFAKGFQASYKSTDKPFNPFVDGNHTDIEIVRVGLLEFCNINPKVIVDLYSNDIAKVRGQIINLVDNGIIVEENTVGIRQWRWKSGQRAGQPIGNQILDPHSDSRDALLNYIQANLSEYYDAIMSTSEHISSEKAALQFLESKKQGNKDVQAVLTYDNLPQGYGNVQQWLGENGFSKAPALAKKVKEAIENKEVHDANLKPFVESLISAMEVEED